MLIEEGSDTAEFCESATNDPAIDSRVTEPDASLASKWTSMASAAAGAALGMPFDSHSSLRAAWVEVSQRIAALRK